MREETQHFGDAKESVRVRAVARARGARAWRDDAYGGVSGSRRARYKGGAGRRAPTARAMATAKYKDPSPFQTPRPAPPSDDYHFARYQANMALDPKKRLDKPNPERIGVALCGCGKAGSIHLSNLATNPRVKIWYIVDDIESNWESIRTFWHFDDTTKFLSSKDSDQVFSDPRVEAVIVATPTYTHEQIVRAALNSGKAVFCEKPIASNTTSTKHLYELAQKVSKPLMCAFNRRFDTSFSYVRQQVRAGKVGHVQMIKTCSRDSPMPGLEYLRISGGIFHDCTIHDIDIICWILGELPSQVFTMANANIPEIGALDDYDTVAIVLNFPSGTIGIIDVSRRACYGYDQRLEVFGPRGMLTCQNERPMPGVETQYATQGCNHTPIWYSFPSRFKQAYADEMEHFLDGVEGKTKISVDSRETLAASKIACAVHESAKTGQKVTLTWAPEEMLPID